MGKIGAEESAKRVFWRCAVGFRVWVLELGKICAEECTKQARTPRLSIPPLRSHQSPGSGASTPRLQHDAGLGFGSGVSPAKFGLPRKRVSERAPFRDTLRGLWEVARRSPRFRVRRVGAGESTFRSLGDWSPSKRGLPRNRASGWRGGVHVSELRGLEPFRTPTPPQQGIGLAWGSPRFGA